MVFRQNFRIESRHARFARASPRRAQLIASANICIRSWYSRVTGRDAEESRSVEVFVSGCPKDLPPPCRCVALDLAVVAAEVQERVEDDRAERSLTVSAQVQKGPALSAGDRPFEL